jgi:glycopeptide antibiotics resistance protein
MTRPGPTARHYALLALGAVAFTVYGSLVPFDFVSRPWSEVVDGFWRVAEGGVAVASRSDFLANCLLGVPLGFCLLGALRVDRPGRGFVAGVGAWLACVAVAVGVEFAQAYFPPRTAALSDVLAQATGAATGIAAWWYAGQRVTNRLRETGGGPAGRFLAAYLLVVVAVQLLPLDLTASPTAVYRKLRDGHATLTPFGEWFRADGEVAPNRWGKVQTWLELFGLFFPAGLLAVRWRPGLSMFVVAGGGLAFAATTELGQLLVSRHPSVTDALVGASGVLAGWAAARRTRPPSLELALVLGQAWFAVLAVAHWQPFVFVSGSDAIGKRFAAVNWLPFADLATRNYLGALDQALERLILFVPLGVLVAARGGSPRLAAGVGIAASLVLELGQFLLPDRFPSTTDLFTAALGAWTGAKVTERVLGR